MLGLTQQQVEELKLKDSFVDVCIPSGGFTMNPDPVGRRTGRGTYMYMYINRSFLVGSSVTVCKFCVLCLTYDSDIIHYFQHQTTR